MSILNARVPALLDRPALPKLPGFRAMLRAAITRRQLAHMDDRMLKDIGISRSQAEVEGSKPFWRD